MATIKRCGKGSGVGTGTVFELRVEKDMLILKRKSR